MQVPSMIEGSMTRSTSYADPSQLLAVWLLGYQGIGHSTSDPELLRAYSLGVAKAKKELRTNKRDTDAKKENLRASRRITAQKKYAVYYKSKGKIRRATSTKVRSRINSKSTKRGSRGRKG